MGQAKDEMGGLPMPHDVMGDPVTKLDRLAGSALGTEPTSGLEQQASSKYSPSSSSKLSRSKYLSESGRQSFGS